MPHDVYKFQRLSSVDLLRGLVIIMMALGHMRLFSMHLTYQPEDIEYTNSALFFTRWITSFNAPVFVVLAGLSLALRLQAGKSKRDVSIYLLSRGIWLIVLEVTVVHFAWSFNFDGLLYLQIIWVLGASMVLLSVFLYLPKPVLWCVTITILLGHNLFDTLSVEYFGSLSWLYSVLRGTGLVTWEGGRFFVEYPIVPWFGVMLAGYLLGDIYRLDAARRQQWLVWIGAGMLISFFLLRLFTTYGDPVPWTLQAETARSVFSFLNAEKYPPSLIYLTMRLGIILIALAVLEKIIVRPENPIIVLGRVPLFFYITHLYLIHGLVVFISTYAAEIWQYHPLHGLSLPGVYVAWLVALLVLYPACAWYNRFKQKRHDQKQQSIESGFIKS